MSDTLQMSDSLKNDVTKALTEQLKGKVDTKGKHITKIECPSCGKAEAWAYAQNPWVIVCGRANKCGDHTHVKDQFPELFNTWTERYTPATEEERLKNPTAVADGYLRDGRGFDLLTVRGWYSQDSYYNPDLQQGSTTVRFKMPHGFWERVLDKPERFGKQKARCVGDYAGEVWAAPTMDLDTLSDAKEIWIVEGIFDAIALMHKDIVAVSSISCSNYPSAFLAKLKRACPQGKGPRIVFALDSDKAGQSHTVKHALRAQQEGWKVAAAQPTKGKDWNDLLQLGRLEDHNLDDYRYYGSLLLAKSPTEKAILMYTKTERKSFWFSKDGNVFWFNLDMEAYANAYNEADKDDAMSDSDKRDKALRVGGIVKEIGSALVTPLYFQQNRVTGESWYYMQIETPDGIAGKFPFAAKHFTSANEYKNRLLDAVPNAWYSGTTKQLEAMMQDLMKRIKTVETIDYLGYSKKHGAYIYNDIAIKGGAVKKINDEDYFEFGKLTVKSLALSPELQINANLTQYKTDWAKHLLTAFDVAGTVTLAWWLGSLFAEQIREEHKSYPFFELVGLAGAGKSTLIEFLWKLVGRADHEGADPNKATAAARSRMFSQLSNLPVVMIESDREQDKAHSKQFDWDELKTAYNGRATRSRGVKNNGNDTYEPPFRGSVMISQNARVDASEAILSRILHLLLTREHQTPESKIAADWLSRVSIEEVSGFLITATAAETKLMQLFNTKAAIYENQLLQDSGIRMVRIAKNHAQLMALVDCLSKEGLNLIPDYAVRDAYGFILNMARERQTSINSDHPAVVEFWEAYDYIQSTTNIDLNHANDTTQIAINLKEYERWCGDFRLRIPDMNLLRSLLRGSKARKFLEANRSINSKKADKTMRCWLFEDK
jgi:hypothetical protein